MVKHGADGMVLDIENLQVMNIKIVIKKLYELIKRITVMSHMQNALFDVLTLRITHK